MMQVGFLRSQALDSGMEATSADPPDTFPEAQVNIPMLGRVILMHLAKWIHFQRRASHLQISAALPPIRYQPAWAGFQLSHYN